MSTIVGGCQCDQMARLIFQHLAIYNIENLPNSIRKLQKWQHFAESGHTCVCLSAFKQMLLKEKPFGGIGPLSSYFSLFRLRNERTNVFLLQNDDDDVDDKSSKVMAVEWKPKFVPPTYSYRPNKDLLKECTEDYLFYNHSF